MVVRLARFRENTVFAAVRALAEYLQNVRILAELVRLGFAAVSSAWCCFSLGMQAAVVVQDLAN